MKRLTFFERIQAGFDKVRLYYPDATLLEVTAHAHDHCLMEKEADVGKIILWSRAFFDGRVRAIYIESNSIHFWERPVCFDDVYVGCYDLPSDVSEIAMGLDKAFAVKANAEYDDPTDIIVPRAPIWFDYEEDEPCYFFDDESPRVEVNTKTGKVKQLFDMSLGENSELHRMAASGTA